MSDSSAFDFYGGMRVSTVDFLNAISRLDGADRSSRARTRARLKLGVSDLAALQYLLRAERDGRQIRLRDLCSWLDLTPAACSALCGRLETAKLLGRVTAEHDRRGKVISLTDDGRELLHRALDEQQRRLRPILDELDDETAIKVIALIDRVITALDPS